ncbi:MAG: hypothetical protein L3J29_12345 [Cyclobacteriaceae bacterium]|nr:hypothetical protein [Cyclobacteriaceae bacterium]
MKTPFSIKLIYWIVNFILFVSVIGVAAVFVEFVLSFYNSYSYHFFKFEIPLKLDLLPVTEVMINGELTPVKISKIHGNFNVWDLGIKTAIILYLSVFLKGGVFSYALHAIKKILINVKANSVFTFSNVNYFKKG